ncbi:MAG: hypothetical protein JXR51_04060 [Bacteroidales bacterium]|nr:hypothetical protein [Bacteroidales bacterium]
MEKILFALIFFVSLTLNISAQTGSIKIFTNLDEAKFKLKFQDELQNTIVTKSITLDSLETPKYHEVIITFSSDTIADIEQELYLLKDQQKEFEIKKKATVIRKTAKIGRKIGKFLRIGDHDKENIIYDVFYLEDVTKSDIFNN